MNKRIIFYNLGRTTMYVSVLLFLMMIISLCFRDGCAVPFLISAIGMLVFGFLLTLLKPKNTKAYAREGFVAVTLIWIALSVFGALPFYISGYIPSFIDALFETVSGFTTTGASILRDVEALTPSLLFWRSLTHWVGGMGVLALAIAVMPSGQTEDATENAAVHLLKAETPGPTFGKLVSKLRYNVRILYAIYTVMTVVHILFLLLGGMPLFDSILTAFGSAGTGGFAIKNSSIAYYDSAYIETVVGIFMLLFGINFNIYYFMLTGNLIKILKSEELRWYLAIIASATVAITWGILPQYNGVGDALRYAFFQVSSIITTTGYVSANYDLWPVFARVILVLLMLVGACASSTGGGFKVSRLIILVKNAYRELRMQIHPREVRVIRCDGEMVGKNVVSSVSAYFGVYMLLLFGSVLLVSFNSLDTTTTTTAVISCLNNIGPGLGGVGATGNFADFSAFSKIVLSFNMLAGRLELYPILVALSPYVWKRSL